MDGLCNSNHLSCPTTCVAVRPVRVIAKDDQNKPDVASAARAYARLVSEWIGSGFLDKRIVSEPVNASVLSPIGHLAAVGLADVGIASISPRADVPLSRQLRTDNYPPCDMTILVSKHTDVSVLSMVFGSGDWAGVIDALAGTRRESLG